ncbi:MAG TPA: hypothetical protein PKM43_07450 [Verrucomicrobiota bacterium]|nr:hypothetical protein [Verrucomicrobiota bacterium]HRZ35773.1 hypothetical protein [Candidatus Paceibacterota bacterium]HRZ54187.1 hypothetical protein [Candidatus Paceibacterota bacterium]
MKRPRVLLADDHRLVAEGLKSLLSPEFELLDIVEDGRTLVAVAKKLRPDAHDEDFALSPALPTGYSRNRLLVCVPLSVIAGN